MSLAKAELHVECHSLMELHTGSHIIMCECKASGMRYYVHTCWDVNNNDFTCSSALASDTRPVPHKQGTRTNHFSPLTSHPWRS